MVAETKTYESIELNFIVKTKEIFGKAQELAQQQSGLLTKVEVLGLCERYIESIIETVKELEPFEEYSSEMDVYKIYGKIFLFAQEVMIGSLEGTTLGFDLLRWSKNGMEEVEDMACQLLQDVKEGKMLIEEHPCYWNLVIFNILTGEFQNAKGLLQEHSNAPASDAYATVISKLSQLKSSWFSVDSPLTKFKEWQDDLRNLFRTGFFKSDPYLSWVVNILIGDMDTYKQLAIENIETWYQILPAVVFFCFPETELFDIEPVLNKVLDMFPNLELNMSDNVMLAILRNDWIKVSEILLNEVNDFWLAAHIYDTIYKTSPNLLVIDTVNLRDLVVQRYADTLFSKGCYVTAIGYFMEANLPNVEELISRRIMETPDIDEESSGVLLQICDNVGLNECRNEIGKRMTKKYLSDGDWTNSLQWSLSSKNKTSIANVCNTILESASSDDICQLSELDSLMRSFSTIPHVLILRKYIQCNIDLRSGELLKGAENLAQIILSNHASTKFTFTLIRDLIMVLGTASNERISIFDSETCHQLSRFLAFFELDVNRMLMSGDISNATRKCFENETDLLNEIRLFKELLINEMTRAFVFKLYQTYGQNCENNIINNPDKKYQKEIIHQIDEKNFSNWILNNIELIKKDNNDNLPKQSSFGTIKINSSTICTGDDEKKCIKKFINLETRIRTSPKYNLIACLIQKNMSTLLQAIMCLLYDEILFLTNSRSLIYETSNIRLCKKLNEFNSPYKAIQYYDKIILKSSWKYIAITRNPIDRFISNFIDRCIRKPTKGIKSCNGCNFNMTCFVISEYQYMLKESTTKVMRKEFEDMHFFPQNWRCDFKKILSNYTLIRYKNKNNNDIEDVVNSLNNIFHQQKVPNTTLNFIKNQLLFSRTMHTTVDTGARKFFENRLINSPFLMEYIVRMYYYDFKLFNYTIPELQF